ncbi:MAG: calcium-binding protein, partial [Cyanobacteria bacterium J06592_8]
MAIFTVNTLVDENDGIGVGDVSLRDAITEANSTPGADTIEFEDSLSGGTITLANGQLTITDDLTISGLGADQLTIDADGQSRVFNVDDGNFTPDKTVDIDGLTITGGQVSGDGGGIFNRENLNVTNSTVTTDSA